MTSSPLRFVLFCTVVLTALAAGAVPDAGTVLPVRVDGGVTDAGVADDAGDGFADAGVLASVRNGINVLQHRIRRRRRCDAG